MATTVGVAAFATGDYADESDAVQAVVDFYGISDLTTIAQYPGWLEHDAADSPESRLLGGPPADNRALALANSPVTYIAAERSLPPFLIVHGDSDPIVPFNQSVRLYEALRATGHTAVFYSVKGGKHGWDFWSPRLMQLVIDFFDRHLKETTPRVK